MSNAKRDLSGARVMILEDDFYLATDLQGLLEAAGATVIGPFRDEEGVQRSLELALPDCAFIDINLGHGPSFDVPRELTRLAVPFAFVTGYDASAIPTEFDGKQRFHKPVEARMIVAATVRLLRIGEAIAR